MTGYTTPDNLPYPNDYNEPADVPAATEALADATQTGLSARRTAVDTDARYVATAGSTMTGNLTIDKAGSALYLDGPSGSSRLIYFRMLGVTRWAVFSSTEGQNLTFARYTENGDYLDAPLVIDRATGHVTLGKYPTAGDHAASKTYADNVGETARDYADDKIYNTSAGSYTDRAMSQNAAKTYTDYHVTGGISGEYTLPAGSNTDHTITHGLGTVPACMTISVTDETGKPSILATIKNWNATTVTVAAANWNETAAETYRITWIAVLGDSNAPGGEL